MYKHIKLFILTLFSRQINSKDYEISTYIDGTHGFVLNGEAAGYYSGYSVSSAGDINGDGYSDIIIGAYRADPNGKQDAGKSYVVFGGRPFNQSLELSNLTGTNGFVINGEAANDLSGRSVSSAGDINGDGYSDIIIGAPSASSNGKVYVGKSYVVFGGRSFNQSLELSNLTGTNGFVLNGEAVSDYSGNSVSSAGDINGDGYSDIIIGARYADPNGKESAGKSYVVFGGRSFNQSMELSSLNGTNGFVLNGEATYDYSGSSVSSAGDINGDGYSDIIIGAPQADPNGKESAGKSYVVFGGRSFNQSMELSNLTGTNGFVLNGEAQWDRSGYSVSSAGDINGDGYSDIIIGAPYAYPNGKQDAGKSYVVFGGQSFNQSLELSNLTGTNGFVLNGEAGGGRSGYSVSIAGDINGDGYSDIIIGAPSAGKQHAGKSYVVFGGQSFNQSLELSSLNSTNGFVLNGEAVSDYSGYSVSIAGDINGDGYSDIIIGVYEADPNGKSNAGKSYVVFGNGAKYIRNSLSIASGAKVLLTQEQINILVPRNLSFTIFIKNEKYGRFERVNDEGVSINSFTPDELRLGQIQFVQEGLNAPSYEICVYPGHYFESCQNAEVTFYGIIPILQMSRFEINQGEKHRLLASELSAVDPDTPNLTFNVTEVKNGMFEYNGQQINSFSNQDVTNVWFVPDGSKNIPSFKISVGDDKYFTEPEIAKIGFNLAPVISLSTFVIDQEQSTIILSKHLSASDKDSSIQLLFSVSAVNSGQFSYLHDTRIISEFSLSAVVEGLVRFIHVGTEVPSFNISVSDGLMWTQPVEAEVVLNRRPVLMSKLRDYNVTQGKEINIDLDLSRVFQDPDGDRLSFTVSQVGGLSLVSRGLQFNGTLFGTLNSLEPLALEVVARDTRNLAVSSTFNIYVIGSELLLPGTLIIGQGQTKIVQDSDLLMNNIKDIDYFLSNIQYCHFEKQDAKVKVFSQSDVTKGLISIVHDGSLNEPSYTVSVSGYTQEVKAGINFKLKPKLILKPMIIDQNTTTRLSQEQIDFDVEDKLIFEVKDVQKGFFTYIGDIRNNVTEFTGESLLQKVIGFQQSGADTPSFAIRVGNSELWSDWQQANITLNHKPLVIATLPDKSVVRNDDFSFEIADVFTDPDGDKLTITAKLAGGIVFKDINFDVVTKILSGKVASSKEIEFTAKDPRGLSAVAKLNLKVESSITQKLREALSVIGIFSSFIFGGFGFFVFRVGVLRHRKNYKLANLLRKRLNLNYNNFGRFAGDNYRTRIEELELNLNCINPDLGITSQGFLDGLEPKEYLQFTDLLGQELLKTPGVIKKVNLCSRFFSCLLFFDYRSKFELDFDQFDTDIDSVATHCLDTWQHAKKEEKEQWKWEPRLELNERMFCISSKVRKLSDNTQDVEMVNFSEGAQSKPSNSLRHDVLTIKKNLSDLKHELRQKLGIEIRSYWHDLL